MLVKQRTMSHHVWSESCVSAVGITRVSRTEGQKGQKGPEGVVDQDVVLGRPVSPWLLPPLLLLLHP